MKYPLPAPWRSTLKLELDPAFEFEYQDGVVFPISIQVIQGDHSAFEQAMFSFDPDKTNVPVKSFRNNRDEMIQHEFCDVLALYAKQQIIETWKVPGVLSRSHYWFVDYSARGAFPFHSDNGLTNLISDKIIEPTRKFTAIFYFNEPDQDYVGGELVFDRILNEQNKQLVLSPSKGSLVIFPSNIFYRHGVTKIEKGRRRTFNFTFDVEISS